jgi:hypothetical protein
VGSGFKAGLFQSLEHRGPAPLALAEGPVIQLGEQLANGLVQIFEQEELVMAQRRHDPALGELHRVFDFGFVESHRMQVVWDPPQAVSA